MSKAKNLPKDTNLLAKMVVDIATGEKQTPKVEDKKKTTTKTKKRTT